MIVYHYDASTGEYVGSSDATQDPLEEGRFLIPANSTTTAPPSAAENKVAVFDGAAWSLQDDFRGAVYWMGFGDKREITEIGLTVPEGASMSPPPRPAPTEAQLADQERDKRDALILQADYEVNRLMDAGQDAADWRSYRQALRDVPQQAGFPTDIDWPTPPAEPA